jgi:hypothetical protein
MTELVFTARPEPAAELEVRVNFGVFAGRNATQAEIDDLARALHAEVESFAIVAQERHEFGGVVEASLRQVLIEIPESHENLETTVLEIAERWARACIQARSDLGELGSEI